MWLKYVVESVAVLILLGGVGGIMYGVFKGTIELSSRTIQFLAVAFALPMILILSFEGRIGSDATSAFIGMVVGFALSEITRRE